MKKKLLIVIVILIIGILGFFIFKKTVGAQKGDAVLKVTSTPTATIFLNNESIGKTPYEEKVKAGEYTLKLIPESTGSVSWEGRIKLNQNLLTYVNRELKDTEQSSSGEMLTLEKISGNNVEISVISTPDGATVLLDESERGSTPLVMKDLDVRNFDLSITKSGAVSRSVKVKTTAGYRVNSEFSLATISVMSSPSPSEEPSPEPSSKASPKATPKTTSKPSSSVSPKPSATSSASAKVNPPAKPYIEVQDTPTGTLNVREEASTSSTILTRINPGEFYPLLDEDNGWYKIEYEAGEEGWVSSQYATKKE